jgi:hypothetical protein
MRVVLKTNDPVLLNFAETLLKEAAISSVTFDTHMSVMEGSVGVLPRRLMVADEEFDQAREVLKGALPDVTFPP